MSLIEDIGIGRSELIAFTGAGGKSTSMFQLAAELTARGERVVITTTTKMGSDQVPEGAVVCRPHPADVNAALERGQLVMAVHTGDGNKVTGPADTEAAALLRHTSADHLLVEADGSRGLPLKAPADHEPVVPPETTIVVVCAGLDAVGRTLASACHRPERGAELAGRRVDDPIRPEDIAAVVGHPRGGLAGVPEGSRVVVALTKAQPGSRDGERVALLLAGNGRIDRVIVSPASDALLRDWSPGPSTSR